MIKVDLKTYDRENKILLLVKVLNITEDWKLKPFDCKLLTKFILSVTDILKRSIITKNMSKEEVDRLYEDAHMLAFTPEYKNRIMEQMQCSTNVVANSLTLMRKVGILSGISIDRNLLLNIDKLELLISFKND